MSLAGALLLLPAMASTAAADPATSSDPTAKALDLTTARSDEPRLAPPTGFDAAQIDGAADASGDNPWGYDSRGDVLAHAAGYEDGIVAFSALVETFEDPSTSHNWNYWNTGIVWDIDVNGDYSSDYWVGMVAVGGAVGAAVFRTADDAQLCTAGAFWDAGARTYSVAFPGSCIGAPASFRSTTWFRYETDWDISEDITSVTPLISNTSSSSGPTCGAGEGYWLLGGDGGVFAYGDAPFHGSTGNLVLNAPVVGMASAPNRSGYWFVASDGGIFSYGVGAGFHGSTGGMRLNKPIVGMAARPQGDGYWLVASDGGIFAFGGAAFHGSTGAIALNKPIVGMAVTPTGNGYWLVASDGGIFAFGDATFEGSTGSITLSEPIVGLAPTNTGRGYWMVASDGGIFAFGDAVFRGSPAGQVNASAIGIAVSRSGAGYRVAFANGAVRGFDASTCGDMSGAGLNKPLAGMATS